MISDGSELGDKDTAGVKGFATIDGVSLINVEGTGMVGVPGTAAAIFTTMRDANVNVIMISQASSEHSVCFAVKAADSAKALDALKKRCVWVGGSRQGMGDLAGPCKGWVVAGRRGSLRQGEGRWAA